MQEDLRRNGNGEKHTVQSDQYTPGYLLFDDIACSKEELAFLISAHKSALMGSE